ncbi:MGMT family protein [Candidatus Marsarchaeota archaeon]|nr:MGMT family protein [Candidatus Marsarchaeota archaeon]MCL5404737.1 MGMT family protein [Candidatus Marsarchaeota archaeon]
MNKRITAMLSRSGLTEFQKSVLIATATIPKGQTRTYKEIAIMIGHPRAYRAVGSALAKNPFAPAVPCHRVIRSNGDIGNYSAAGGKKAKRALLNAEGAKL